MVGVGGTIEIAVRDVAAGEEITCEYATLNLTEPMDCRCGASGCRRTIGSDDLPTAVARPRPAGAGGAAPRPRACRSRCCLFPGRGAFWAWVDGREPVPSCRTFSPRRKPLEWSRRKRRPRCIGRGHT